MHSSCKTWGPTFTQILILTHLLSFSFASHVVQHIIYATYYIVYANHHPIFICKPKHFIHCFFFFFCLPRGTATQQQTHLSLFQICSLHNKQFVNSIWHINYIFMALLYLHRQIIPWNHSLYFYVILMLSISYCIAIIKTWQIIECELFKEETSG